MGLAASLITISSLNPVRISERQVTALAEPTPLVSEMTEAPELQTVQTLRELIAAKTDAAGVSKGLALRIAFCESTYRQFNKDGEVLRGVHNPDDVGVFQINEKFHLKKSQELDFDIYSTEGNIDYAIWILKNRGSKAWNWSKSCWNAK